MGANSWRRWGKLVGEVGQTRGGGGANWWKKWGKLVVEVGLTGGGVDSDRGKVIDTGEGTDREYKIR